jgi:4-amino-4-deoxy-L-arabinose transferase-like glycosyltransferase
MLNDRGKYDFLKDPEWMLFFLLLALSYLPLFAHLDSLPMHIWDEARVGGSALEMLENGKWLVTYFDGKIDTWSVKPPLLIWIQVVFLKIFGVSELALRLPSALAGLFTCLAVYVFSWRVLKSPLTGFVAALVLLTTQGFVAQHVTRTGDYDALLTMWTFLYAVLFFTAMEAKVERIKRRGLLLTGLLVGAAVLTKGVAGLFFLPPMLMYALFAKSGRRLLANRYTWLGIGLGVVIIAAYYLSREWVTPGYLELVWKEELGGRFLERKNKHHLHSYWFYFHLLQKQSFLPWLYFLPLGLFPLFAKRNQVARLLLYALLIVLFLFFLLSASQTKIRWYIAPAYPFLALIAGAGIAWLIRSFAHVFPRFKVWIVVSLAIGVFLFPYRDAVRRSLDPRNENPQNQYAHFIRQFLPMDGYYLADLHYNGHMYFYEKFFHIKGYDLEIRLLNAFEEKDSVMLCGQPSLKYLKKHYEFEELARFEDHCWLVKIEAGKEELK